MDKLLAPPNLFFAVNWFLWNVLLVLMVAMLLPGIWDARQRIQLPFLAAAAGLFHVLYPLHALIKRQEMDPMPGLGRVIFMAILCYGCTWAGYQFRWRSTLFQGWKFDEKRLSIGAIILALGGLVAGASMSHINIQTTEEGQMTGLATVLIFLTTASRFGFVVAALLYIRSRKRWLWLVMLPQLSIYFQQLLVARRSPMGELVVSVLLLLFFARRWTPPLWLIAIGVALGAFYHFNIGTLRSTIGQPMGERIRVLKESRPLEAFTGEDLQDKDVAVELNNAANYMNATTQTGAYTYGRHFWNQLVFGWVPAQFVGRNFKEALKFDLQDNAVVGGYEKPFGTCETGLAEAYMTCWFFGALLFFAIGAGLRFLWEMALQGSFIHQALLTLCTFGACMTFSGQIWSYVNVVSQVLVFTVPVFWWSRIEGHHKPKHRESQPVKGALKAQRVP